jgi:hypothetical protein
LSDPEFSYIREVLELSDLSVPDVDAYEGLAQYEREAAELGFPENRIGAPHGALCQAMQS